MAWTSPMTAVSGQPFSAGQFNRYIRDNLNELAAAKATIAGQFFVADGKNTLSARTVVGGFVSTSQTTTSTAYTDLATAGPSVSCTTGTNALIFFSALLSNSTTTNVSKVAVNISGANSEDPRDDWKLMASGTTAANPQRISCCRRMSFMTPGTSTFTLQYGVDGGTGTFATRSIIVIPL